MMQITETLSKGLKRGYEVTVLAKDLNEKLNKSLENIGKRAQIPGFRPGKIPLSLLKQKYNDEALRKVLEDCIESSIQKIVKDHALKPALKPQVSIKSFEEGKDLAFEVNLEVLPVLGDIQLKDLSFVKHVIDIPKETVTSVLEKIARRNRQTHPLKKARKTQKGDVVIIDFEGFIGKDAIEGGAEKNYALELGSNSFIDGFEDQLTGREKGDHGKVKVTFPKGYHEEKYAGKPATFDVTITDIQEADPIKIDDALAKQLGFESLKTMQEWAEKTLSRDYENQSFFSIKRHVLDELADRFVFEVPQNMIDLEFDNIWKQLCNEIGIDQGEAANTNVKGKTATKSFEEATGKKEEELREEYQAIAERRVRLGILLAEIGNRNDIKVSSQELQQALVTRAREFPGREQEVFDFYKNNESALATLRAPIFENKVIEFVLTQSKVTDKKVTPEQLQKLLLEEEKDAEKKLESMIKKQKKPSKKKDT
jgi:trigger factor